MKIECDVSYVDLENDDGYVIEGVSATCLRCDYSTESYGSTDASVRRCLVLMREECPNGENNYYVEEE